MLKKQDRQWTEKQRHHLKWVAWVNIFALVAFPVAATLTPAVVTAKSENQVREDHRQIEQTRPYRLSVGESIKSVAKRHGLTVTELKRLNQQRVFHKPFAKLGAGDEIDVPHSTSDQLLGDSLKAATGIRATEPPITENSTERWLASTASHAAGMINSGNIVDNAKRQLQGMAVSEANQAVRNWLQRYGNVKVQANVDDRGRLDGSQFDMLLPLYDTAKHLTFTQFGLRHIDSRTTANFGLGQRHFLEDGMFGYNAFLDHDITREHTRFGIGAEYARDFMKFGINGYFRASGWKEGQKLTDYEERPANGFDLRAEGYVPTYPQLGGKFIYEQYFGNEVGLLSETERQKNPAAFTLGVNYTPIPLVTLGLDRRQSAAGGGETLFNFGLNYEIGTPWSKQVNPNAVAFKRTLQGGRYDLVERNNQIVLEYRKKNLIRLMMETRISGRGGAVIPLNVNVSAKHGLKEIIWDTASLVAGGGKLESMNGQLVRSENARGEGGELFKNATASSVRGGTHYLLTLPSYNEKGNNTYSLSGVAYDKQGNASERMEAQIQVIASAVNPTDSGFEPANKSMVADGKTQTVIRLKLTDKDGKPITDAAGSITLTDDKSQLTGDGKDPVLGTTIKEVPEGSGIYEIPAIAGTKHGKWAIIPKVDGHELPQTVIDFGESLIDMVDTGKTTFEPKNGTLSKEGESTDIVLKLTDKDGNPIAGAVDKIKLTEDKSGLYGEGSEPKVEAVREDPAGSGIYKAKVIAGGKTGTLKVTPTVDGKELKPTTITFGDSQSKDVNKDNTHFEPANKSMVADGKTQTVVRLKLGNKDGKPVTGIADKIKLTEDKSELTGDGKDPVLGTDVKEVPAGSGIYEVVTTAGTKQGKWKITPMVDGHALNSTVIDFGESVKNMVDPGKTTFKPKNGTLSKEGESTDIVLELTDKNGNPIAGAVDKIKLTEDKSGLYGNGSEPKVEAVREDPAGSGIYKAKVIAGGKTGTLKVTPTVDGKELQPTTITFGDSQSKDVNKDNTHFEPANKSMVADGKTQTVVRLKLGNKDGKPVNGIADKIKLTEDKSELTGDGKDPVLGTTIKEVPEGSGIYEVVTTAGTKQGKWKITPTVDGHALNSTVIDFGESVKNMVDPGKTTFKPKEGTLSKKGESTDIVLELTDKDGNPITGAVDKINLTEDKSGLYGEGSEPKLEGVREDPAGSGIYKAKITAGEKKGVLKVTPTVDGQELKPTTITFGESLGSKVDDTKSSIEPSDKNGIVAANGTQQTIIKIVLKDHKGDPLSGIKNSIKYSDNAAELVGEGNAPAIKEVKENPEGSGIYEVLADVGGKTGKWKITTKVEGTDLEKVTEIDLYNPDAKPTVDDLILSGKLIIHQQLTATYIFNPNQGEPTDQSTYQWIVVNTEKNNEEVEVDHGAISDGNSGKIVSPAFGKEYSGRTVRFTITPTNGKGGSSEKQEIYTGKVDEKRKVIDPRDKTTAGTRSRGLLDPDNAPTIKDLTIMLDESSKELTIGAILKATYQGDALLYDGNDSSRYNWGEIGKTAQDVATKDQKILTHGEIPPHEVSIHDGGKVLELTVQPRINVDWTDNNEVEHKALDGVPITKTTTEFPDLKGNPDGSVKGIADSFSVALDGSESQREVRKRAKIDLLNNEAEHIELTIKTSKDGTPVGGVPVTINLSAMNQAKTAIKTNEITINLEAQKKGILGKKQGDTVSGQTDGEGNLVIKLTDPEGLGVKTTLKITAEGSKGDLTEKTRDVIFSVITSPNVKDAQYYGHMPESVPNGNGLNFHRLKLVKEISYEDINPAKRNKESWAQLKWNRAESYCKENMQARLPTIEEAKSLAALNKKTASGEYSLYAAYGWPVNGKKVSGNIWTSESDGNENVRAILSLNDNKVIGNNIDDVGGGSYVISCVK
ncbi:putative invasin [Xenorhabdus mauleonii]|uniref:Invasin n=1 Tax=Xenorhabdus mauleonii TaxID=351675 RepID=A0A1I3KJ00_9GAMM|nr:inverse autotransporter beta domain-containing protein [Xenorhabdus mauleonii]PHM45063.1 putative invasin [Xenorhabdus mauleonii]SFI72288.1 Invasin, domain 3 [Xenorhabdus mauleonii]